MQAIIKFSDNTEKVVQLSVLNKSDYIEAVLPVSAFENKPVNSIDFAKDYLTASKGSEGYAVIPSDNRGTLLCFFNDKEDRIHKSNGAVMSCFGFRKCEEAILAIAIGCENDLKTVLELKDGIYALYAHYVFDGTVPYEDITVRYYNLGNADYSKMAECYRNYAINEKGCVPIKERIKNQPELAANVDSIEVRLRLGWKPAPSPYAVQTLDNEPEMHVAITFDDVLHFADALKAAGVEKAELCLVGWNIKGHDGRWPQCFPVEDSLGGEEKLINVIEHVKSLGYSIVGHTNHRDMYKIADIWDENDVAVKKDGSIMDHPVFWSGGQPFVACPEASLRFAKDILPKTANLGFSGLHYIDVLTVLPLHRCHSNVHPATTKDTANAYGEIQKMSQELFGGFASEGPYDYAAKHLDYVLYTSFNLIDNKPKLCDEIIPFWQLVYHGIILSNPGTETVNYIVKNTVNRLKFIEYGGRPSAYVYSKFLANHDYEVDWMGSEDLTLRNEADFQRTIAAIKAMYDEYQKLSHLQYEFMIKHEKISSDIYEITYSDGSVITVDYGTGKYTIK